MNPFRPIALAAVALTFFLTADRSAAQQPEYYELRTYRLASQEKAEAFDKTFGPALVEAMEAAGVGPIGVFKPVEAKEEDNGEVLRYVLMPYKNIDQWAKIGDKLKENSAVWEPALEFLMIEKSDANYSRIDSSLLVAFDGMPKLKLPEKPKDLEGRHFEIRVYESHSVVKGALKVEMFNKGGIRHLQKSRTQRRLFRRSKGGEGPPPTHLHARLRQRRSAQESLEKLSRTPGMENAQSQQALQGYGLKNYQPLRQSNGVFADQVMVKTRKPANHRHPAIPDPPATSEQSSTRPSHRQTSCARPIFANH